MRKRSVTRLLLLLLVTAIGLGSCAAEAPPAAPAATEAVQANTLEVEIMDFSHETENVIYLAGGCFWGLEQLMQSIPGVIDAESGYANGTGEQDANYSAVCAGDTGFRETVRVEYDPEQVSLDALLLLYRSSRSYPPDDFSSRLSHPGYAVRSRPDRRDTSFPCP